MTYRNTLNLLSLLPGKTYYYDWEQRKLGEISTRILRKNKNLQSTLPLTISAQDGLVDQTTFFHKQVASKQLSNYILLFKGDFAYNKSYSVGYPLGAIKRLNRYSQGVLSTLYIVFRPKNIKSDFLEHYYATTKWYQEIYRNAAEGARNHGLLNISAKDFFDTTLYVPQNDEQALIAAMLDCLDSILALQQRKLELLKQVKKGLLQKMFADKNENQPVLRFKGFNDNWEFKRLGNVFSERKDRSAKGQLLSVSISKGVYPFNENERKNNSSKDKSHYKSVNIGDIAYNSMRMWQGAEGVSKYKGIVSPAYTILSPKGTNISDFFGFMFKRIQVLHTFQAHSQGLTPDTWNLKYPLIRTIKVNIPSSKEQKIISRLFVKLDLLISMQEQELTKYQSIKKALLQQMFI